MFHITFTYIRIAWSWQDPCACAVVLAVSTDTFSMTAKGDDDFALTLSSSIFINIGCCNVSVVMSVSWDTYFVALIALSLKLCQMCCFSMAVMLPVLLYVLLLL